MKHALEEKHIEALVNENIKLIMTTIFCSFTENGTGILTYFFGQMMNIILACYLVARKMKN